MIFDYSEIIKTFILSGYTRWPFDMIGFLLSGRTIMYLSKNFYFIFVSKYDDYFISELCLLQLFVFNLMPNQNVCQFQFFDLNATVNLEIGWQEGSYRLTRHCAKEYTLSETVHRTTNYASKHSL